MTKRDLAQLLGWLALVYLLWDARAVHILTFDSSKRVARLEAEAKDLRGEIDRLHANALERQAYWETLSREVDWLKMEVEANEQRSTHRLDETRD